ncbi:hypothetical protein PA25_18190 [Pseudoalteromonas sp. A25]|uniref:sensor histidine kinase n=1 Tax=Pseudoalteromonas sp. A25 TaxID=116092 RepID=UPI001261063C|nr:histidine kinase [Pseudoalteromonas sp. A25]BBN81834.1 hypothetical protein PA25_18190 [Pseudoalteromonas sp. A25]
MARKEIFVVNVLAWLVYASLEHMSHLIYGENHWLGSVLGAFAGWAITMFLVIFHQWIDSRATKKVAIFGLMLATFIASITWHNVSRVLHYRDSVSDVINNGIIALLSGASYSVLLFCAWLGLYFVLSLYLQKQLQQQAVLKLKAQAKEAQLQSLRYQLNPHFLFNVLNSIDVAVLENDNSGAHNMIAKLSRLLRVTLATSAEQKVTVKQEMSLLDDLMGIEQQRYAHRIEYIKDVDPSCEQCMLPSLLLQPLLENAIKFTWHANSARVITLKVAKAEYQLLVCISNPIHDECQTIQGTHSGLNNVKQRIQTMYANTASMNCMQDSEQFIVELRLPLEYEV